MIEIHNIYPCISNQNRKLYSTKQMCSHFRPDLDETLLFYGYELYNDRNLKYIPLLIVREPETLSSISKVFPIKARAGEV